MKRNLIAATVCILTSSFAFAEVPKTDGPGWRPLFKPDYSDAQKPEGVWSVTDGVLTANADQCIWTGSDYSNFILDLEFKTAPDTNSGVILYCNDTKNWIPPAVEIQIADDFSKHSANSPSNTRCGSIFGHVAPSARLVKQPGEWNRMTIEARGQKLKVWLNGTLASEMDMAQWTSTKTNPDGSGIPAWLTIPLANVPTKGRIGFQGKHGAAPIWFRNIQINQLAR